MTLTAGGLFLRMGNSAGRWELIREIT